MGYKFGILTLAGFISVVLSSPRCFCPPEYNPVCGTDDTTYLSECLLDCAKKTNPDLAVASNGTCPREEPPCTCTDDNKPVCGTDGITYVNDCLLNCATAHDPTLGIAHFGACEQNSNQDQAACTCARNYRPICGSDGVTYANECLLKCSGQGFAKEGPCEPPCICPKDEKPVCGSDGVTYGNDCLLNCATKDDPKLSIANWGPCSHGVNVVEHPKCSCPGFFKPVCGNDGKTYDNKCFLKCAGQRLAREGPCEPPCTCTAEIHPVCGSDGVTYDNDCLLNCATINDPSLSIAHWGACSPGVIVVEQPPCTCTRNLKLVCGANGLTYSNICLLRCAGEKLVKFGPCEPPCVCPLLESPVCGSDGVTYSNDCLLNCATKDDPSLRVAHAGACGTVVDQPACACGRKLRPVCGVDGVTYNNKCLLRCAGQRVAKEGPCEPPCECPAEEAPVCGSDGVTYGNDCLLNCATKDDHTLRVASHGPCCHGVRVVSP